MPLPRIDPTDYSRQLAAKVERFREDFAAFGVPEPVVHASAPLHYRLRAEFRMWHEGDRVDYAMFDLAESPQPLPIDTFPAAAEPIADAMPVLRERLMACPALRRKLFQVDFLSTLSGRLLITLVYHRPLDADWEAAARDLAAAMGVRLVGRSRRQKIVIG